jgi:predicted small lipoprotein YifL
MLPSRPLLASVLAACLAAATVGCGQRGPLYLRDSPPPGMKPAKPEAHPAVPYPKGPADEAEDAKKR